MILNKFFNDKQAISQSQKTAGHVTKNPRSLTFWQTKA